MDTSCETLNKRDNKEQFMQWHTERAVNKHTKCSSVTQ